MAEAAAIATGDIAGAIVMVDRRAEEHEVAPTGVTRRRHKTQA